MRLSRPSGTVSNCSVLLKNLAEKLAASYYNKLQGDEHPSEHLSSVCINAWQSKKIRHTNIELVLR